MLESFVLGEESKRREFKAMPQSDNSSERDINKGEVCGLDGTCEVCNRDELKWKRPRVPYGRRK